jgi:hypothetical protein
MMNILSVGDAYSGAVLIVRDMLQPVYELAVLERDMKWRFQARCMASECLDAQRVFAPHQQWRWPVIQPA